MPFQIVHNDITRMHTDAVVNAANGALRAGGGVCGAIFRAAGVEELERECREKAPCPTGQAVITGGYGLKARYIIHAVGPVWQGGGHGEAGELAGAYRHALALAEEYGCESVSFPLISAGIYGYPKEQALTVATETIRDFLKDHEMDVYLVVFDRGAVCLSEGLFDGVRHYIDTYFEPEPGRDRRGNESAFYAEAMPSPMCAPAQAGLPEAPGAAGEKEPEAKGRFGQDEDGRRPGQREKMSRLKREEGSSWFGWKAKKPQGKSQAEPTPQAALLSETAGGSRRLEELLSHVEEGFSQMLMRLIDEKGYSDVEVYKRANMDRKLFSKIRSNREYHPKKATVLSLAVALRLSVDEATDLLQRAGYSFSNSSRQDIIVRYFLEEGEYDMFTINETLFCFEEPLLGA